MEITFYTTHCPKCKVLKTKMDAMGLVYNTVEDVNEMEKLSIFSAPALKINNTIYDFGRAIKKLKEIGNAN